MTSVKQRIKGSFRWQIICGSYYFKIWYIGGSDQIHPSRKGAAIRVIGKDMYNSPNS